jgi:general secretion pathway protein K
MVTTDSFSANTTAAGEAKANINTAQVGQFTQAGIQPQVAAAIIARRNGLGGQFTTLGEALQTPGMDNNSAAAIIDGFSLSAETRVEGKINLNTATKAVLETIPNLTPDLSSGILSRQTSGGFSAVSELLAIPGFDLNVVGQVVDSFTTSSDTFLIRVIGTAGQTSVALEGVVRIENGQPILMKMMETPLRDMRALWNWEDEATNEVEISG